MGSPLIVSVGNYVIVANKRSVSPPFAVRASILCKVDAVHLFRSSAEQNRIRLDLQELSDYAFYDPQHLDRVLSPRLVRRVSTAVTARRTDQLVYAEHAAPRTLPMLA